MGLRLVEIAPAYRAWSERVEDAGGELTPDLEAELASIEGDLAHKAHAYAGLIREAEVLEAAHRAEAARQGTLARIRASASLRLKERLLEAMTAIGADRVRGIGPDGTPGVVVVAVNNPRPAISWGFAGDIPVEYRKVEVRLDGTKAWDAYRVGQLPEGFKVEHGRHLRIT